MIYLVKKKDELNLITFDNIEEVTENALTLNVSSDDINLFCTA